MGSVRLTFARLALFFVACTLSAPGAGAVLTLSVRHPTTLLAPGGEAGRMDVEVRYVCTGAQLRLEPARIQLALRMPTGLTASGPQSLSVPASACMGPASSMWASQAAFYVQAARAAPGLQPMLASVQANISAEGTAPYEVANVATQMVVDYFGQLSVRADSLVLAGVPGQTLHYTYTVEDLGNARTDVIATVVGHDAGSWQAIPPAPLVLEPSGLRGSAGSSTLDVKLPPSGGPAEQAIHLRLTPVASFDSAKLGRPVDITFLARMMACPATPSEAHASQATTASATADAGTGSQAEARADLAHACQTVAKEAARLPSGADPNALTLPGVGPLLALALLACALVARRLRSGP